MNSKQQSMFSWLTWPSDGKGPRGWSMDMVVNVDGCRIIVYPSGKIDFLTVDPYDSAIEYEQYIRANFPDLILNHVITTHLPRRDCWARMYSGDREYMGPDGMTYMPPEEGERRIYHSDRLVGVIYDYDCDGLSIAYHDLDRSQYLPSEGYDLTISKKDFKELIFPTLSEWSQRYWTENGFYHDGSGVRNCEIERPVTPNTLPILRTIQEVQDYYA